MGYKDWLRKSGHTDEQIEGKLAELDECCPIEVDSWDELDGKTLNDYRMGLAGSDKHMLSVSQIIDGKERNIGMFNLKYNPTFAIESWFIAMGINVMVIGERIGCDE